MPGTGPGEQAIRDWFADLASDELSAAIDDAKVIEEPCGVVAGAMGIIDAEPVNVIAYVFDDDDAAEDAIAGLESAWSDAALLTAPGLGIDEFYELRDVARTGRVAAVTAAPRWRASIPGESSISCSAKTSSSSTVEHPACFGSPGYRSVTSGHGAVPRSDPSRCQQR